jgi:hypothetical protein
MQRETLGRRRLGQLSVAVVAAVRSRPRRLHRLRRSLHQGCSRMLSLKLAKVLKEAGGAVRLGRLVTSIDTDEPLVSQGTGRATSR